MPPAPDPTGERWAQVEALLDEALERAPPSREAFLAEACAGDPELAREVRELLAAAGDSLFATEDLPGARLAQAIDDGPAPEAPDEAWLKQVVGRTVAERYRVEQRLGAGAAGVVFGGRDLLTDDAVALKVLAATDPATMEQFRREQGLLRLLRLPGVVRLLDEAALDGRVVLVLERVRGDPFPGTSVPLRWEACAPAAFELLRALARIHWTGVVHRDLKPANVLVSPEGRVTVLDLGIALPPARGGGPREALRGTPAYLAPEQLEGEPASARSDLYACGLMLFEALAGSPAHPAESFEALVARRVLGEPPAWSLLAATAPPRVVVTLQRLLARDPAERPASAREALALLRGAREPSGRSALLQGRWRVRGALESRTELGAGALIAEGSLRALFHGPDRLLHLSEDGARELWRRTLGKPEAVARELEAWTEHGLARWEDERLSIDRPALALLRSELWVREPASAPPRRKPPPPPERRLLALLQAAGGWLPLELMARAEMGELLSAMSELLERGWLRRLGARLALDRLPPALVIAPAELRAARETLVEALPAGTSARLRLLVAAGRPRAAAEEGRSLARRALAAGELSGAASVLLEALAVARRGGDADQVDALLAELLDLAFERETLAALEQVLSEAARVAAPSPALRQVESLARAALWAMGASPARAFEELEAGEPFAGARLERWRWAVRIVAARKLGRESVTLAGAVTWAESQAHPEVRAAGASWQGWAHYRAERFAAAGEAHELSAARSRQPVAQAAARLNAASAWLEAGELERSESQARAALSAAAGLRHAFLEARAEQLLRAVGYRGDWLREPDDELVAASGALGVPMTAATVAVTEAAIAWRWRTPAEARPHAALALDRARRLGFPGQLVLASALCLACGAGDAEELVATIRDALGTLPAGIALQALAFAAEARPELAEECRAQAQALPLPRDPHGDARRRELISAEEAWARLGEAS